MGNLPAEGGRAPLHAFYSTRSWIEGNATKQLEDVASLSGVIAVAGMPDLHPGKMAPPAAAFWRIGSIRCSSAPDIGCGMGLLHLDVAVRKLRIDKAAGRLRAWRIFPVRGRAT
jgi:release factor H-coupled RctB family protein